MKQVNLIIGSLLAGICLSPAYAAFEESTPGARARSMAGALGASSGDSALVFVQPAGLFSVAAAQAAITYGRLFYGLSDDSNINDSILTLGFPVTAGGAVGLGYKKLGLERYYSEETFTAGAGWRFHPLAAIGVSGKYLLLQYGADDYTRADPVFAGASRKTAVEFDAGILFMPHKAVTVSIGRKNLLGQSAGLAGGYELQPADRLAISYCEENLFIGLDSVQSGRNRSYMAGMEQWLMKKLFAVRIGGGWQNDSFNRVCAGFGLSLGAVGIDYAFDYPVSGIEKTGGSHYVTLVLRANKPSAKQKKDLPVASVPAFAGAIEAPAAFETPVVSSPSIATAPVVMDLEVAPRELPLCAPLFPYVLGLPAMDLLPKTTVALEAVIEAEPVTVDASTAAVTLPVEPPPPPAEPVVEVGEPAPVSAPEPAPVAVPAPEKPAVTQPSAPRPGLKTHKVSAGETLPFLAEKYYGNSADWTKIYEANEDEIEKGSLKKGQLIIIP